MQRTDWIAPAVLLGAIALGLVFASRSEPATRLGTEAQMTAAHEAVAAWEALQTGPIEYRPPFVGMGRALADELLAATLRGFTPAEARKLLGRALDLDTRAQGVDGCEAAARATVRAALSLEVTPDV